MRVSKLQYRPEVIANKVERAIGRRHGDFLKIENQWASVTITHRPYPEDAEDAEDLYIVTEASDTQVNTWGFKGPGAALQHALTILLSYESGRAD